MADSQNIATPGSGETPADEPKTYTQEQVEAIVQRRLANVKATPPADYDELKEKAALYDAAAEAAKSELERATERADAAEAELAQLKADAARAQLVAQVASEAQVDAALLARMTGDTDEAVRANAAALAAAVAAVPQYTPVRDAGEAVKPTLTRADIAAIKNPSERRRAMAENLSLYE